ncbi:heavy metal translocating P-type ATPase [uncultured Amnibacterium sp.]|uniref:heavy metal translocating P-type ATPase n=1 Tax=uncultured Amnibacterium sp. TaxID=1631851 RepID=UPI0035CAB2B7
MAAPSEVRLDISGMTCAACATRIERRLNRLPGASADVNFATETAVVRGGPALPDVVAAVEAAGYGARLAGSGEEAHGRGLVPRLVVAAMLAVPVVLLSMVPALHVPGWQWVALALAAPVVGWSAWPFHRAALRALRHGDATMDSLISLGVLAATAWSVVAVLGGAPDTYLEVGVVVTTFVLAGRVAEKAARRRAGAAVRELAAIGAKDAIRVSAGGEALVPVSALVVGDRVRVRPGATVPSDGRVLEGRSAVDAALVTGEALPVEVGPGDRLAGGTVVVGGSLDLEVERVGADTELARIGRLVARAQDGKAAVQRLADRVAGVFVPVVIGLAVVALAAWWVAGDPLRGVSAAVTTLIIACPCALGLATPTALLVGTGRGARLGVLISGPEVLERTRRIDTVVLDKTGTLTTGRMRVGEVVALHGQDPDRVLRLAAAAEHDSEHPVGRALVAAAAAGGVRAASGFRTDAGGGVTAQVEGALVQVGRLGWLADAGVEIGAAREAVRAIAARGATATVVAVDGRAVGVVELADTVRSGAADAIGRLRALGLTPVLLTGDGEGAAHAVAAATGIDRVFAAETPEGKLARIRALQAEGRTVAMVGDGVNDAAALAAADLGVAMGGGTDAAAAAADMTLLRDDPLLVPTAIRLARATLGTIRGNLFWAFAYNAAALPVAMLGLLSPMIAGGAMALSSVLVVGNSLRLTRFRAA